MSSSDLLAEQFLLGQVQLGTFRTPRFLHVKTMSGEYLFNVEDITGARHQGVGRTMILTGNGDFVVDIGFDAVRAQLAKFAIIHDLDPSDEAKP